MVSKSICAGTHQEIVFKRGLTRGSVAVQEDGAIEESLDVYNEVVIDMDVGETVLL